MSRNQKEKLENYLITVGPRKKYEYFHSDEKKYCGFGQTCILIIFFCKVH